jgi:hypothetical protein
MANVCRAAQSSVVIATIAPLSNGHQRILAAGELPPHRAQGLVARSPPTVSGEADGDHRVVPARPRGGGVLSIDEKTGMQALERRFRGRPAPPGGRGGASSSTRDTGPAAPLWIRVHHGRVVAECRDTRTAADLISLMATVAVQYFVVPVHVMGIVLTSRGPSSAGPPSMPATASASCSRLPAAARRGARDRCERSHVPGPAHLR